MSLRSPAALLWACALALGACKANGTTDAEPAKVAQAPKQQPPPQGPVVTDVTSEHYQAPPLPRAQVILTDAFGGKHPVDVEVAATEASRTRGLMWRTELPGGKGMLFVFPSSWVQSFWMRNTLIPLDLLFIEEDGTVVGIVPNAEPRTLTSRTVGKPSKYVLEVPGGWTEQKGIQPGSKVEFRGVAQIPLK